MRKRQSFLLTILTPDDGDTSFHGQLKVISSGKTCTFTSQEELYSLIASEMGDEVLQQFAPHDFTPRCSDQTLKA